MAKWSIRDLWGKRTEKTGLNPGMRDMLTSLDGVYDPKAPADASNESEREQEPEADPAR